MTSSELADAVNPLAIRRTWRIHSSSTTTFYDTFTSSSTSQGAPTNAPLDITSILSEVAAREKAWKAELVRRQLWEEEYSARVNAILSQESDFYGRSAQEIRELRRSIEELKSRLKKTGVTPQKNASPEAGKSEPLRLVWHYMHPGSGRELQVSDAVPPSTSRGNAFTADHPQLSESRTLKRKRPSPVRDGSNSDHDGSDSENDDSEHDSDSDESPSRPPKRIKRISNRRAPKTIHHAMRHHLRHMLRIAKSDDLPASHIEGTPLSSSDPVRFVWAKTIKQSVHNYRMKVRVLEDIKANRRLYPGVPVSDFLKKPLDAAFEQCFTTLRQKYRAQTDEVTALNVRMREQAKYQRRRSRMAQAENTASVSPVVVA